MKGARHTYLTHDGPGHQSYKVDQLKDAIILAIALVGVICLLSAEGEHARSHMAASQPLQGNSPAIVVALIGAVSSIAGWKHGKAAPAARKAAGLPSVDAQRLVQHDVFNLVVLPVLMVLNIGSWLGLVSHYLYTVLFAAYIGADFLYIWAWPEAVPQPSLVLAHHSFVLALLSHPLRYPLNAHFTANVAAVEFNTIVMVGRRHFAEWLAQEDVCRKIVRWVMASVFWTSYFGIRFVVHPWMVWVGWHTVPEPVCERFLLCGLLFALCGFNTILLLKQLRGAWDQPAAAAAPAPASAAGSTEGPGAAARSPRSLSSPRASVA